MDPSLTETHVLLTRCHHGDRAALDKLLARDLGWLRQHVRSRLGSLLRAKGEVDDYVQEAMVEILRYGPRFVVSDKLQFRALLARITENVLRDHVARLRSGKRNVAVERQLMGDTILCLDPPQRDVTRPSTAAHRGEERAWIRLAIELLPGEDRELVRLREWEHATFAAIGDQLDISEDAARMRFQRILPRLARNVENLRRGELSEVLKPVE